MATIRNILNKTNPVRLMAAVFCLVVCVFPMSAADEVEETDSVFTFKFLSGRDMFYVPLRGNGNELTKLFDYVERYKDMIADRSISLHVDGYCISNGNKAEKPGVAKTRSNRVKSELITRKGLKEDNFITHNHPGLRNFVTVRFVPNEGFVIPMLKNADNEELTPPIQLQPQAEPEPAPEPESTEAPESPVGDFVPWKRTAEGAAEPVQQAVVEVTADTTVSAYAPKWYDNFAVKTNLLGYAVLMPNIEIEWKFAPKWSAAFEAQGGWWSKNKAPRKVYRIATWIPEVRYWPIRRSKWHGMYVGLFAGGGKYDIDNGKKGHEGEGYMGGVSAGYMWPIGKHLSLDAGLGVGYMRLHDKSYIPVDGHFLFQMTKHINYFGPLRAKLSLVWRFEIKQPEGKQ